MLKITKLVTSTKLVWIIRFLRSNINGNLSFRTSKYYSKYYGLSKTLTPPIANSTANIIMVNYGFRTMLQNLILAHDRLIKLAQNFFGHLPFSFQLIDIHYALWYMYKLFNTCQNSNVSFFAFNPISVQAKF